MKKIIATMAALMAAGFLFAEAQTFTVKSVKGNVTYQTGSDKWSEVVVGKTYSATTVVKTGLNSTLVLTDDSGAELKIKPAQNGTIEALTKNAGAKGIKKAVVSKTDVSGKSEGGSKGIATASSRASDAQSDLDWDE
ncbi:MAG: hypothetical protein KBT11_06775 [Treponema sp.]|nr:hypothetical protein [Candidatus Treponema equifaecale]